MPDSDPCASLGLRNEMLYCYWVISATPPGHPGSMVQSENRSNGSLWIIVYFWIGGNGIIDFDFFDGRDYLEQSGRTQNKGCFIPMPGLRLKIFDSRFYSSCILYLLKAPTQIGQTVINKHFVWSVAQPHEKHDRWEWGGTKTLRTGQCSSGVFRHPPWQCDVWEGTNPSSPLSYAIAITHLRFVSQN